MNTGLPRFINKFLLVTTLLFMGVSQPAWSNNFMSWNADSAVLQNPAATCGSLRNSAFDTIEKHEGAASMRLRVTDSQSSIGCRDVSVQNRYGHPLNDGSSIYYRWWMKIDSNFNWGTNHKTMKASRIKQDNDVPPPYLTGFLHKNGIRPVGECLDCTPASMFPGDEGPVLSYSLDPAVNPAVTNWQEYIVRYKWQTGSSENAEAHIYVNGVLKRSMSGFRIYSGTGKNDAVEGFANSFMANPYTQVCPNGQSCGAGGVIWVDDFSVDDSWNSNVGPQPMPPMLLPVQ